MVRTAPSGLFYPWPVWRNGRRKGLKIPREKSHVGSIPTPGTLRGITQSGHSQKGDARPSLGEGTAVQESAHGSW